MTDSFVPHWASPPGDTIRASLKRRGLSLSDFADASGLKPSAAAALLSGDRVISVDLAKTLATVLGGSISFWITRDAQYREDLDRLDAEVWARQFPTAQMVKLGWVDRAESWHDRIRIAMEFFDVSSVAEWTDRFEGLTTESRFRTKAVQALHTPTVSAWLRRAEIEAEAIATEPWNADGFKQSFSEIRALTSDRNPQRFLPKLRDICSANGVAMQLTRPPAGSRISGVARFVRPDKAQIFLTGRYLADDQLWFTFFHEAAHLLLHGSSHIYVDDIDVDLDGDTMGADERVADEFAAESLLPLAIQNAVVDERGARPWSVKRLAQEAGVSVGVAVGILQHRGVLTYKTKLNRLKRRYRWDGPTLEMA